MKKIISAALVAVILVISVFSVSAFAQEQTKAEKWDDKDLMQFEAFIRSETDGEIVNAHMYIKDKKISFISEFPLTDNKDVTMKVIISDGHFYLIFPSFPFFYLKYEITDELLPYIGKISATDETTLVNCTEITDGDTIYYVEEYVYNNGTSSKFYFVGDELYKLESKAFDEYGVSLKSEIQIVTCEVDDSMFEIPWYSINLTPLLIIISESYFF